MTRLVLRTKLFRPPLPGDFVPRAHLCDALDQGLGARLILITAPAGFGKSTLVASWLRCLEQTHPASELRTSWLSLSESDNDLRTFWSYLVAAIESAYPDSCPATQELLATSGTMSPTHLAGVLAGECQDLPGQLVLAIDDLYLIQNADVHEALAHWLDSNPPGLHVVLISRVDPRLGVSRLRARRQLLEVRLRDLQFTPEESAAFLSAALERSLPTSIAQALHQRTEGWAAGLRLAALSLRSREDLAAAVRELELNNNRYTGDYLTEEVLNTLPTDVQDFLIRTASLPRLCAGLCAAVLSETDTRSCQHILEDLFRGNVFLVALDDHDYWYRYHHQFQATLMSRRQNRPGMPSVADDQRRAADWLASNAYIDDALALYIALHDYDSAETLIITALPDLQVREAWHGLSRKLDRFPADETERRPGLLIARACAQRMLFRESDVTPWTDKAEALLDANPDGWSQDHVRAWRGTIDVLRCLSDTGLTPAQTVALAERAMVRLPKDQHWARAMALSRASFGMMGMRRTEEALSLLSHAAANVPHDADMARMRLYYAIGVMQGLTGTTASFLEWAQRTADLAAANGIWWVVPIAHTQMGETHYQMNDLESALRHFERVFEWEPAINFLAIIPAAFRMLKLSLDGGNLDAWDKLIDHTRATATGMGASYVLDLITGMEAYKHLVRGDRHAAKQWAFAAPPSARRVLAIDQTEIKLRLMAEILLILATPSSLARARDILVPAIAYCDESNNVRAQIMMLVLLAQVHFASGDKEAALDVFEQAITLGEPRGYVRCFIDAPDTVKLLKQLVRSGRCIREASQLIDAVRPHVAPPAFMRAARPNAALVEPLTERELEILTYLSEGLTNKEVGARLKISPLTVRNHTGHIYTKLGVATRRQAVERAATLGLLDPLAI